MGNSACCSSENRTGAFDVKVKQTAWCLGSAEGEELISASSAHRSLKINRISGPKVPIVIVTDPGQDLDDEMAFIMLRYLVELGAVDIRGIITTLTPAFDRARLCRGTLDVLGLFGVPIGVGSDGGDMAGKHKASTFVEWARPYMPPRFSAASDSFQPGRRLLRRLYEDAAPSSLTLVVIAALKDPALFLRDYEDLFKEKTREVVIMGGVEAWKDESTELVPDTANNNTFDMDAARFFHMRCQELGVPLVIVSRWAAYAAKVPRSCYDELASTGSWIACRLRNAQRASIEQLWARAVSPAGSAARQHLPDRCDRAWFLNTFCNGADAEGRGAEDTIWDLVAGFMQYDTIALLVAIPELRKKYFLPAQFKGLEGVEHLVIGRTQEDHGISDPDALSQFLNIGFTTSIALNHHRKMHFILLLQPRWSNHAENVSAIVALRALYELGIFDCAGILLAPVPDSAKTLRMGQTATAFSDYTQAGRTETTRLRQQDLEESRDDMIELLGSLGLSHVPVLTYDPEDESGVDHLQYLYERVTPAGITLVCTGTLEICADFAERHSKLFVQKTQRVILMGGAVLTPVTEHKGAPEGSMITPDEGAQNNQFDMKSAERFYKKAQMLLVPLIVVSRHFAQAVQIPRTFFDTLGNSSYAGSVGKKVYEAQRKSIHQLWHAVRAPADDTKARKDLPQRCNQQWFVDAFCGGIEPSSDDDDAVWKSIGSFNIYNVLAVLLALPPVLNWFAKDDFTVVRSIKHRILGSPIDAGVLHGDDLRKLVMQCIFNGTRLNASTFNLEGPPLHRLKSSRSSLGEPKQDEEVWSYDVSNEAMCWLLPSEHELSKANGNADLWSM